MRSEERYVKTFEQYVNNLKNNPAFSSSVKSAKDILKRANKDKIKSMRSQNLEIMIRKPGKI